MTLPLFAGAPLSASDSSDHQCTPRDLALDLGRFDLDVASNGRSHILADRYYALERGEDALTLPWTIDGSTRSRLASVWCNGPYSNPLPFCVRLREHSAPWASLWKLDTTTRWFAELLAPGPNGEIAQWAPFRSRLRFERPGNCGTANFASVLVWRDWEVPEAVSRRLWMPRNRSATRNPAASTTALHAIEDGRVVELDNDGEITRVIPEGEQR